MTRAYTKRDILERFMAKVEVTDECWIWLAWANNKGYGVFNIGDGIRQYAHRWAYEAVVEPIPDGLEIDHLCRNRICVNPDHLEPVTHLENIQRATLTAECLRGHPRTPENTWISPTSGRRDCRACNRERHRRHRSTDLRKGCPGDPASTANQPPGKQFAGII